ncbi:hypothetical protein [Draconibacterium orientale]|uniref:hypothetical protein n=1 Tax=Draconibacterium orientale TaxID=1168034 RepID=UPI0029BFF9DC|nr:hypothetical protein [Draconibacterium orientale]
MKLLKWILNHPLAGEDLFFAGKVIDVREASDEEVAQILSGGGGCGCGSGGGCSTDSCGDGSCGTESGGGCGCGCLINFDNKFNLIILTLFSSYNGNGVSYFIELIV